MKKIKGNKEKVNDKTRFWFIVAFIGSGVLMIWLLITLSNANNAKDLTSFAQCLTEKNVTMYGTYWCPHCTDQKKAFGPAFTYINYVECDARGENEQSELCIEKQIQGYPTWEIEDKYYEGVQSLQKLSELTNCEIYTSDEGVVNE